MKNENLLKKRDLLEKIKQTGLTYSQMGKLANELDPILFPKKVSRQRVHVILTGYSSYKLKTNNYGR
jgi:hypothetical protein